MSKTLVIIKPDGVKRKLIGEIITRFENKNITISQIQQTNLTPDLVKDHYSHLRSKPFFTNIIQYMTSGPVVLLVLEAPNVIEIVRKMVGSTNPNEANLGTIRFDYAQTSDENIIHASDSEENAQIEINRFGLNQL